MFICCTTLQNKRKHSEIVEAVFLTGRVPINGVKSLKAEDYVK